MKVSKKDVKRYDKVLRSPFTDVHVKFKKNEIQYVCYLGCSIPTHIWVNRVTGKVDIMEDGHMLDDHRELSSYTQAALELFGLEL